MNVHVRDSHPGGKHGGGTLNGAYRLLHARGFDVARVEAIRLRELDGRPECGRGGHGSRSCSRFVRAHSPVAKAQNGAQRR